MAKPGDDKDACVIPHAAGTVPGTPSHPHYAKPLCTISPWRPCWVCHRPTRPRRGISPCTLSRSRSPTGEAPPGRAGPASRCRATPPATRLAPVRSRAAGTATAASPSGHSPCLGKATAGVIYAVPAYPPCEGSGNTGTQWKEGRGPSSSSARRGTQHPQLAAPERGGGTGSDPGY